MERKKKTDLYVYILYFKPSSVTKAVPSLDFSSGPEEPKAVVSVLPEDRGVVCKQS